MLPGDLSPYAHPAALAPRTSSDDLDVLGLLVGDSTTRIDMWSNEELGRDLAPEHPVAPCSTCLHCTHNYRRPSRRMCHHPEEAPPSIPPPQLSAALEHVGFSAVDIYDEVCCILPDLRPRSGHRCARVCLVMSTTAGLRENCCCPVFRCGRRTGGDRVHPLLVYACPGPLFVRTFNSHRRHCLRVETPASLSHLPPLGLVFGSMTTGATRSINGPAVQLDLLRCELRPSLLYSRARVRVLASSHTPTHLSPPPLLFSLCLPGLPEARCSLRDRCSFWLALPLAFSAPPTRFRTAT